MVQLLIIYGPPASGKRTVADALAAKLHFTSFTNHVTIQFVSRFLPQNAPGFFRVVDSLRRQLILEMLGTGQSVVFTFAYSGSKGDTAFLTDLAESADQSGADVRFVRLSCSRSTLLTRVTSPDRRSYGKLMDAKILAAALRKHSYDSLLPGFQTISVDTDVLDPGAAAEFIATSIGAGSRH